MKTCPTETPECPAGACGVRRRLCWRNLGFETKQTL